MICMLGCEQLMLMPVPSVVSADASCCTWALITATAEKGEGKTKDHQRSLSSGGSFPRETVRNSGSETELHWNGWRRVPINRDGEWSWGRCVEQGQKSGRECEIGACRVRMKVGCRDGWGEGEETGELGVLQRRMKG